MSTDIQENIFDGARLNADCISRLSHQWSSPTLLLSNHAPTEQTRKNQRLLQSPIVAVVAAFADFMPDNCSARAADQRTYPGMSHGGADQGAAAGAYARADPGIGAAGNPQRKQNGKRQCH